MARNEVHRGEAARLPSAAWCAAERRSAMPSGWPLAVRLRSRRSTTCTGPALTPKAVCPEKKPSPFEAREIGADGQEDFTN